MQGAVNTKSSFSVFHVESTWQVLSKPHMNSVLPRQWKILLSSSAPCWELHQWFPHAVKAPAILPLLLFIQSAVWIPVVSGPIHHAVSTLCYQAQAFLNLLLSYVPEDIFLAFALWSCHSLVQIWWLMHRSSTGVYTTFSPMPLYFSRNIQLCCFQCSPWQENTPVSSPYFPNAACERQLRKTAIHKQGYGSPAFKKTPAHHSLWSPGAAS